MSVPGHVTPFVCPWSCDIRYDEKGASLCMSEEGEEEAAEEEEMNCGSQSAHAQHCLICLVRDISGQRKCSLEVEHLCSA